MAQRSDLADQEKRSWWNYCDIINGADGGEM